MDPDAGYVIDLDNEAYSDMIESRRRLEPIAADTATIETDFDDPDWIEREYLDPQLSAAIRALRDYGAATGHRIGFKPAGGMKQAKEALGWQILMKEELGRPWLEPDLFRFGASSMLGDIERQLEHHVTGRYAASHRHAAS